MSRRPPVFKAPRRVSTGKILPSLRLGRPSRVIGVPATTRSRTRRRFSGAKFTSTSPTEKPSNSSRVYPRESHAHPFASTNLPSRSCRKNASLEFSTRLWNRSSLFLRAPPRPLRAGRTRPRTACAYAAPATATRRWPPSQLPQRPLGNSLAPCSSRCAGESHPSIPRPPLTQVYYRHRAQMTLFIQSFA
jgi:hypothetical protein